MSDEEYKAAAALLKLSGKDKALKKEAESFIESANARNTNVRKSSISWRDRRIDRCGIEFTRYHLFHLSSPLKLVRSRNIGLRFFALLLVA